MNNDDEDVHFALTAVLHAFDRKAQALHEVLYRYSDDMEFTPTWLELRACADQYWQAQRLAFARPALRVFRREFEKLFESFQPPPAAAAGLWAAIDDHETKRDEGVSWSDYDLDVLVFPFVRVVQAELVSQVFGLAGAFTWLCAFDRSNSIYDERDEFIGWLPASEQREFWTNTMECRSTAGVASLRVLSPRLTKWRGACPKSRPRRLGTSS